MVRDIKGVEELAGWFPAHTRVPLWEQGGQRRWRKEKQEDARFSSEKREAGRAECSRTGRVMGLRVGGGQKVMGRGKLSKGNRCAICKRERRGYVKDP